MSEIRLHGLSPAARLGQIRAALEATIRELIDECPPHEIRQVCDGIAVQLGSVERYAPMSRAAVVDRFRSGASLSDAIASFAKERAR